MSAEPARGDAGAGPPPWAPGYAHRTRDVAPVPCAFRAELEDFRVEEVPLFPASGAGEHVLVTVEKRGLATEDAVRRLARALGVRAGAVGWAGRKDARGVAVQRLSVAGTTPEDALAAEVRGLRVLAAERHGTKLRAGQLAGNRFRLRLRGVAADAAPRVDAVLEQLGREGLPNAFGAQRFGRGGRGHELGAALVRGDAADYLRLLATPPHGRPGEAQEALRAALAGERALSRADADRLGHLAGPPWDRVLRALRRDPAPRGLLEHVPRPLRVLHVSALQARVFNDVLFARLDGHGTVEPGDVAWLHASGACFPVTAADAAAAEERAARGELSATGPLPGPRSLAPGGRPAEVERAALAALGVEPEDFARTDRVGRGAAARGGRRPLRVPLAELDWRLEGDVLELAFRLPPGSYATVLVEELRKELRAAPA